MWQPSSHDTDKFLSSYKFEIMKSWTGEEFSEK